MVGYCWLKPSDYSYPTYRRWGYPSHKKDETEIKEVSKDYQILSY